VMTLALCGGAALLWRQAARHRTVTSRHEGPAERGPNGRL
jgi:hypothetical protein